MAEKRAPVLKQLCERIVGTVRKWMRAGVSVLGLRRASENASSARRETRRKLLGTFGVLPVFGIFSYQSSKPKQKGEADAGTGLAIITEADKRECARLRALDLDDPKVAAKQKQMPAGKIGNLSVGRLISGSNLISMNMHARDLHYVRSLASHYNTEERIFMTLKKCEELGANTIVLKNHNFKHFRLSRYWDEWGGKMRWLADVITTDINRYEKLVVEHLELGASSVYLWGGASDIWYHQNKQENIVRAFEIMKKYDVPVGICAHRLEPLEFCVNEGLEPDYYMKTLHHDRYWSAHPEENRRFMEMYEKNSPNHAEYHDNMYCHDHEETVAFMQDVNVPWIAFKVLAAGAIQPRDGIDYAFENGADFICLGMFDFQVTEDAEITRESVARAKGRKRRWF